MDRLMIAAWHIVALDRTKRLPSLEKLLGPAPVKKPQTAEEQMKILRLWTVRLGGEIRTVQ